MAKDDSNVIVAKITSSRAFWAVVVSGIIGLIIALINYGYFFTPTPSPSKTFSGRVFDKTNHDKFIKGAEVRMEYKGAPLLDTTDSEGIFSFDVPDPNKEIRLRITANGYESFNLKVVPSEVKEIQPIPMIPLPISQTLPTLNSNSIENLNSANINQNSLTSTMTESEESGKTDLSSNKNVTAKPQLTIISLQALFHTGNEGKDKDNGITEVFLKGNKVLVSNLDLGKGDLYREKLIYRGKEFVVNIPFDECRQIKYQYETSSVGGWDVAFEIIAKFNDGSSKVVAKTGVLTVGKGLPNNGEINLCEV